MEIKINQYGQLEIKRGPKWKVQVCPYCGTDHGGRQACGDWCPLFGEPVEINDEKQYGYSPSSAKHKEIIGYNLTICGGTYFFCENKIEDSRS